jgi:hypothetical protein
MAGGVVTLPAAVGAGDVVPVAWELDDEELAALRASADRIARLTGQLEPPEPVRGSA